jgi:hypothetical protein
MIKSLFQLFHSIAIAALFVWFIRWYFKGHFGKYAIFFWLYTIISIIFLINRPDHNPNWPQHDSRTGAEAWEQQYGR